MARAATTSDAFNAVAEAGRREILDALAEGEATVGALVARLRISQPQASKHLAVLRAVDLVRSRSDGRHRVYRANPAALDPVRDWLGALERTWAGRMDRLDQVVGELDPDGTTR